MNVWLRFMASTGATVTGSAVGNAVPLAVTSPARETPPGATRRRSGHPRCVLTT